MGKPVQMTVLAKVVDYVVTDRQVAIDAALENPENFVPPASGAAHYAVRGAEAALDRVLIQHMISEENRLFASEKVAREEIRIEQQKIEKKFGAKKWKSFLDAFEVTSVEIEERLRQKILFRKALATKLRSAKDNAEKGIQEWIRQLRSRYKVQIFLKSAPTPTETGT